MISLITMIKAVSLLLVLNIIISGDCTISIGRINSAAYVPNNLTDTLLYNGSCTECICFAFILNNSSMYEALNCYLNNNTCRLFRSFVSQSFIRIDVNTKLNFQQLPVDTTAGCANLYDQCGGAGWIGPTSCCNDSSCIYQNSSLSRCLPLFTTLASINNLTTVSYVNDSRENATTGTYWGCCKVSCGWSGKASVTNPVRTCAQDGITVVPDYNPSVCRSGNAYTCTNQQPWSVNNTFSYGYAAASLISKNESSWCCACYSLVFTSGPVNGKEMIVQVINTAGSGSNQFVLQIPGGGWGDSGNGCLAQFNGWYSWGNQYTGVSNRSDCNNLPSVLQSGCYWRFDWFMNANNPAVRFQEVSCPSNLTSKTGCNRL